MKIELEIQTIGDFDEKDLKDFIEFSLAGGSIKGDNPFIVGDEGSEIVRVDVY